MKILVLNQPSKYTKHIIKDFINGCWCKGKRIAKSKFPPTHLLYITTVLRDCGFDAELMDASGEGLSIKYIKNFIKRKRFDFVIISSASMSFLEDIEIFNEIKKELPYVKALIIGQHATFFQKESLKFDEVDFIAINEPEYAIRDLLLALKKKKDYSKIKGIGFKKGNKITVNKPYPFIKNLDELPFPDRTLLPKIEYFNPLARRLPYTVSLSSRGCPGKCIFCTSPKFYGNWYRMRSAKNIVQELEVIQSQGYKEVWFRDETFTVNQKRTIEICNLINKKKIDLTWACNARVGTVNKEVMKMMRKAGCHKIKFGVESGSQKILNIIKKGILKKMTLKNFLDAREVGMDTHAHFMVGAPGETTETIKESIDFAKKIKADTMTVGIMTPYPGTELYYSALKKRPELKDEILKCNLGILHTKTFFSDSYCNLSKKQLEKAVKKFYRSFYLRPSYVVDKLRRIDSFEQFKTIIRAGFTTAVFSIIGE